MSRGDVLISGGGTGGHVFPGLAVAAVLASRGWTVGWAGGDGIEARLVSGRGYTFHRLAARPVIGRGPLDRLRAILVLVRSAIAARALVRRLAVRVVIGTGGFVSAPAVLGGWLAGRPVLLVEPNAEVGLANRALSRFADEAALTHETAANTLRCRSVLTGTPIREVFATLPAALPDGPPRLLVLGGSQGAKQLNEGVPAALARLESVPAGLHIVHQTGERWAEEVENRYRQLEAEGELDGIGWEVTPFLDDVAAAMTASHLVISRAGALTLAELCAAGRPSILIPLAAAGGHQRTNAAQLLKAGAAQSITERDIVPPLTSTLVTLLADRQNLEAMAAAARGLARPDAAASIAARAEALAEEAA